MRVFETIAEGCLSLTPFLVSAHVFKRPLSKAMDSTRNRLWMHDRFFLYFLCMFFASVCMIQAASSSQRCHQPEGETSRIGRSLSSRADVEALLEFQKQVKQDPLEVLAGWGSTQDPCTWFGVSCSSERVVKLELRNANLEGALVLSSLRLMDELQVLDLSGNNFHGNLSGFNGAYTGSCGSLDTVMLASNFLDGTIPTDLLSCGTIQQLDLSYNNLTGPLPSALFHSCGSLQVLDLSHNNLDSSLPVGIGQCSSLQQLNLSSNNLTGQLPLDLFTNCSACATGKGPSLQILDLSSNRFSGPISDVIFVRCDTLISVDLSSNGFSGGIPSSIGSCSALQQLNFSGNRFETLSASLGNLTSITSLDVSNNHIVGQIPPQLGQICSTVVQLDLSVNNISGTIPSSFASCHSLQSLNLANNNFSGNIPSTVLSGFRSVKNLVLGFNEFTGSVPFDVKDWASLEVLDLSSNRLKGMIPPNVCSQSSLLEKLLLPNNNLWGAIPAALANCSQLRVLDLSLNQLQGAIPQELSSLSNLERFSVWFNSLTGEIPAQFGRLSQLKSLILNNNFLSGGIPKELSNCSDLEWLCLSNNNLSGILPAFLGSMQHLTLLELGNNSLSGSIPMELANASRFLWVDLNSNDLSGPIPPGLGRHLNGPVTRLHGDVFAFIRNLGMGCRGMGSLLEFAGITDDALTRTPLRTSCDSTRLYIGDSLDGDPDLSSIQFLDLSYNRLDGNIPDEMGYLTALEMLSLGHNQLVGVIPATFSNLRSLGVLDLSHNKLDGGIWPLANCSFLVQIDVSSNNLSGPIPSTGQLSTAPAAGYVDNPGLCGEPLPTPCGSLSSAANTSNDCVHFACSNRSRIATLPSANSIILGILITVAFACMLTVWAIIMKAKRKQKDTNFVTNFQAASCHGQLSSWNLGSANEPLSINVATFERPLRRLTFAQLVEATNGFSPESLIGIGGFGEVYKAELKDGSVVAIKKLVRFSSQGDREFTAEMETLGKINHRNLVPLLGYCKVGEERLLVYEYMHGGSLEEMLHGEGDKEKLTWELRKRIARGAARGLSFLHHHCIPHIIHRDMKCSNVLLDRNLEARVSDFGMARLISALDTHLSVSTIAGTPGYVPPEYCQSFRCSTKGDIYSFGVILLELLTGKRPTDKEEFEDSNLVGWVRQRVDQKRFMEVLDPHLKGVGAEHEMMQYLRVAFDCLADQPSRRPSMQRVVSMFKELEVQEDANRS